MSEAMESARRQITAAGSVVVLTGAGVSAESGVPTFRGAGGLWAGRRVEEVATPNAFAADPDAVWEFYRQRRRNVRRARPNPAHEALVALEERLGDGFFLVTQNVDGLHRKAGSRRMLELHGNLFEDRCSRCEGVFQSDEADDARSGVPTCRDCGGLLRPNVVWFGEPVPAIDEASTRALQAEVFLVAGTSGVVEPAASLAALARNQGASVVLVNPEATPHDAVANFVLRGPAGELLPRLIE